MTATPKLPDFIPPMLAKLGEPFDSDEHLFEVKWDGMRALAFVEGEQLRMYNRQRVAVADRYPELDFLRELPAGLVLDGEIVVTRDGRPDFHLVMRRQHARSPVRVATLAKSLPATFIAFDLLYEGFRPLLSTPLVERREALRAIIAASPSDKLVMSDGVVGPGLALFEQTSAQGLEGIVAKRLSSTYAPGRRTGAWIKSKRRLTAHCAILGFLPEGNDDFKSLIVALEDDGVLRYVGQVGSGIDRGKRAALNELLWTRLRDKPLIPCEVRGKWVEPGLYCTVSYLERTSHGGLRAPVFIELIRE